jgi:hypothetical protein
VFTGKQRPQSIATLKYKKSEIMLI